MRVKAQILPPNMNTLELFRTTECVKKLFKISIFMRQYYNKYAPISHTSWYDYTILYFALQTQMKSLKRYRSSNPLFLETVKPEVFAV